ncbi:MAG: hypothetical protein H6741_19875 [Alphaproteobacteria bacterium]|nr:hypothetical protein [Alphaproteobacteria bacterium]MCB9794965.1 hypothetical protein [Alphaproteobacteria bacterium]
MLLLSLLLACAADPEGTWVGGHRCPHQDYSGYEHRVFADFELSLTPTERPLTFDAWLQVASEGSIDAWADAAPVPHAASLGFQGEVHNGAGAALELELDTTPVTHVGDGAALRRPALRQGRDTLELSVPLRVCGHGACTPYLDCVAELERAP